MRRSAIGICAGVVLLACTALPSAADAAVYWTNQRTDAIGRANLDGSRVDQSFITGADKPCGIAVDSSHLYWSNVGSGTIARSNLDGSGVEQSFITGANKPCGVAVDGAHVYWANTGSHTLGRADLDGQGAIQGFVADPGVSDPCGVAVNAADIFWAQATSAGSIGRADVLNGASPDPSFIPGVGVPCGVAVDAAHVYWADFGVIGHGTRIGRADLDGSNPDPSFIPAAGDAPWAVAVNGTSIYWANRFGDTIGRANLDGSGANPNLIVNAELPSGIAVDGLVVPAPDSLLPAPDNRFGLGSLKRNKRRGTAKLPASVPGPGTLELSQTRTLRGASLTATAVGPVTMVIRPTGRGSRALRRSGRLRVSANVTFTPQGGDPSTQTRSIRLVRR